MSSLCCSFAKVEQWLLGEFWFSKSIPWVHPGSLSTSVCSSEDRVPARCSGGQGHGRRIRNFSLSHARNVLVLSSFTMFSILLGPTCASYSPPMNGLLACSHSDALGGTVCTPQCGLNRDFSRIPANMYICQSTGDWYAWDLRPTVSQALPWPDCTGGYPVDLSSTIH